MYRCILRSGLLSTYLDNAFFTATEPMFVAFFEVTLFNNDLLTDTESTYRCILRSGLLSTFLDNAFFTGTESMYRCILRSGLLSTSLDNAFFTGTEPMAVNVQFRLLQFASSSVRSDFDCSSVDLASNTFMHPLFPQLLH
ncbi:hypothetical protein T4B_3850 [Trichinella pseudospiralis]|uniref:Uncharacterized protein n=1 Tax=Trichinella pseudospiralis TaxID=6337 RepID=A0A0V1HC75_TRIPS|nr:hypothetical protein T4B_3850 [Trichinella pseudospiralis]